jgi:hypothetical protein
MSLADLLAGNWDPAPWLADPTVSSDPQFLSGLLRPPFYGWPRQSLSDLLDPTSYGSSFGLEPDRADGCCISRSQSVGA